MAASVDRTRETQSLHDIPAMCMCTRRPAPTWLELLLVRLGMDRLISTVVREVG